MLQQQLSGQHCAEQSNLWVCKLDFTPLTVSDLAEQWTFGKWGSHLKLLSIWDIGNLMQSTDILDLSCFIFPDIVKALKDVWVIGNQFLANIYNMFINMKMDSITQKKPMPYLFEFYNVKAFYQNPVSPQ